MISGATVGECGVALVGAIDYIFQFERCVSSSSMHLLARTIFSRRG